MFTTLFFYKVWLFCGLAATLVNLVELHFAPVEEVGDGIISIRIDSWFVKIVITAVSLIGGPIVLSYTLYCVLARVIRKLKGGNYFELDEFNLGDSDD